MHKAIRQSIIRKVIKENKITSQQKLLSLLHAENVEASQATISRDLREMNLIKIPLPSGEYQYSFESGLYSNKDVLKKRLKRAMTDAFIKFDVIENMLLIKMAPGNGMVIGAIIDDFYFEEIVGTVGGNDSCLIIFRSNPDCNDFASFLSTFLH